MEGQGLLAGHQNTSPPSLAGRSLRRVHRQMGRPRPAPGPWRRLDRPTWVAPFLCAPSSDPAVGWEAATVAGFGGPIHSRGLRVRASALTRLPELTGRAAGAPRGPGGLLQVTKPIFLRTRASKVAHESPKCCFQRLFFVVRKKKEKKPSPPSRVTGTARLPRRVGFSLSVSSRARVLAPAFPAPSPRPPPPLPTLPDPQGRWGPAGGAARDPERKGPSLGPNAGGVSLDRRRLGTAAGTGDKVSYQSRFGARRDSSPDRKRGAI